jgi:hypothetical protein
MFSSYDSRDATANTSFQVVQEQSTADSTIPTHRIKVTSDNRITGYPITIRHEVTVTVAAPEIEEPKPRPIAIQKLPFRPPLREIVAPWQAKWRLTQQRPRDGLHSS